jgi:hypothetical protein
MSKKKRKPNLPQETLERARREMGQSAPVVTAPQEASKATTAPPTRRQRLAAAPREVNLREEYSYVIKDLENMAILASALLIVLVALSFFI